MAVEQSLVAPPGFVEPSIAQRVLARIVDAVVLLPVVLLIGMVVEGQLRLVAGMAVSAVYEMLLVARNGQTVGKIAMGTRIVSLGSGSLPDLMQVGIRWLALSGGALLTLMLPALEPVELVYLVVVLLPVLRPPLHRGVHDRLARTVVTSVRLETTAGPSVT
jgi:uncharacterized RDD family membrane protein YckC